MEEAYKYCLIGIDRTQLDFGKISPEFTKPIAKIDDDMVKSLVIISQYVVHPVDWQTRINTVYQPYRIDIPCVKNTSNKIRVGYLTSDFNRNAVSLFASCLLKYSNKSKFDLYCYYTNENSDFVTDHLKSMVETNKWFDVHGYTDELLETLIRSHSLDILIDLNAHAYNGKLNVLMGKPAPVILNYLGFPDHAHLPEFSGHIVDKYSNPDETETISPNREKSLYMPRSFLCFTPFEMFPIPDISIKTPKDAVVIGILNKIAKHNPIVRNVWQRMVDKYQWVQLHIKLNKFEVKTNTYVDFPKAQVKYLQFNDQLDEYYDMFNSVDICLDTYPYSGTATTCSGLLMGVVPHTIYDKKRHVSNVSASILLNMGYNKTISPSVEDYEKSIEQALLRIRDEKMTDMDEFRKRENHQRLTVRNEFNEFMEPNRFVKEFEDLLYSLVPE
jgi:predicted O-linked N-acetylglucosamine transferase (SPINDLY family)